jgi:molybdate transport system substrate-binding protein
MIRRARREPTSGAPFRWLGFVLLLAGGPLAASELWVSVAVSLEPAVNEVVRSRRPEQTAVAIHLNGGGSTLLMHQALRGAPVDLFVSASPVELDRLESEGLLRAGSRRVVALNALVLIVPREEPAPATIEALADPSYRKLAVGNPRTAPLGRYTAQALEALGLADRLAPRFVVGENARQVLDWVARAEVDAGIVYSSDARLRADRLTIGPELPLSSHEPVRYEGAVLATATDPEAALALLESLRSEPGAAILRRYGFRPPS